jgi:uroporphyrinogen decarboxylase
MSIDWNEIPANPSKPDFSNLLAVLQRRAPARPTLFEFFLNEKLYQRIVPEISLGRGDRMTLYRRNRAAFQRMGYDYFTLTVPGFSFTEAGKVNRAHDKSVSQNEGAVIHSRADLEAFPWPDPENAEYGVLDQLSSDMPEGMKIITSGPGGVLENAIELVGYENLCLMILDDEELAVDIFAAIGSRLVRYYEIAARHEWVGACISNDDWGFKTHTLFSPPQMRRFVFSWHKKIVAAIHAAGKPAILHSCGHFQKVIEDIIEDMQYDGRHSYEDNILPVEQFYELYTLRIATLGGIDLDFVCRAQPEEVYQRSTAMLQQSAGGGSFALGTGNSVPEYVPDQNYFAMIRAAFDLRK